MGGVSRHRGWDHSPQARGRREPRPASRLAVEDESCAPVAVAPEGKGCEEAAAPPLEYMTSPTCPLPTHPCTDTFRAGRPRAAQVLRLPSEQLRPTDHWLLLRAAACACCSGSSWPRTYSPRLDDQRLDLGDLQLIAVAVLEGQTLRRSIWRSRSACLDLAQAAQRSGCRLNWSSELKPAAILRQTQRGFKNPLPKSVVASLRVS